MKRMMILIVVIISMILGSCDLVGKYDITVKNNCVYSSQNIKIGVYITQSTSAPSAHIPLERGESQIFEGLSYGKYYLHIRTSDGSAPGVLYNENKYKEIDVNRNGTYTVSISGTEYAISFTY